MKKNLSPLGLELIGKKNSRFLLPTPALVLDVDIMEQNIRNMADLAEEAGIQLRPHCKGHKSIKIAHRQKEARAIGISCATLGEAEKLAEGNIDGILITSPIVLADKIERLICLNQTAQGLMVVLDNPENVHALANANKEKNNPLNVLVELDIGQNRTGVRVIEDAVRLAKEIQSFPTLRLVGMQAYGGHLQHIENYDERKSLICTMNQKIKELKMRLQDLCKTPLIVTGGGTGTCLIDLEEEIYTEIQVGSYLFMDMQYEKVGFVKEGETPFKPSLFVLASVVSTHPDCSIVDAGLKAFATDGPKPRIFRGASLETTYQFMGDEHGKVNMSLPLGSRLEFLTPHCDPTINLYDFYHCIRKDTLVDIWKVDARGLH